MSQHMCKAGTYLAFKISKILKMILFWLISKPEQCALVSVKRVDHPSQLSLKVKKIDWMSMIHKF